MKTLLKTLATLALGAGLFQGHAHAQYRFNASDVVRYALTSHGITYLLRDRRGSVNAWNEVGNLERYTPTSGRWGNTDCSGLVSAALRFNGYSAPDRRGKPSLSTSLIGSAAQRGSHSLRFVSGNMRNNARHADLLNRTGAPYGHVVMFNGHASSGVISTVEAKCTRCGVGRFTKTWNEATSSGFRLVRANYVYNDMPNANQVIPLAQASGANRKHLGRTTYRVGSSPAPASVNEPAPTPAPASARTYTVRSGDTGSRIAQNHRITFQALSRANPGVNWNRLQIGQRLNLP
jgi:hypothetical protein